MKELLSFSVSQFPPIPVCVISCLPVTSQGTKQNNTNVCLATDSRCTQKKRCPAVAPNGYASCSHHPVGFLLFFFFFFLEITSPLEGVLFVF